MRAYQLKIAIKDIKSPIWRRIIVPAGITFSQLGMILNTAMGWSGYHMSEFDFYHLGLTIAEEEDEFGDLGYDYRDFADASKTYIRSYLEENEWFTYTYDFGDDWQHRVTVEKILDNYELNYPQVIKFKGSCPPEDCGGVFGYYERLDSMPDIQEYDMEYVNEEYKNVYFYIWGTGESRMQHILYQDILEGKLGIHATQKDKNKKSKIKMLDMHKTEDTMKNIVDMLSQIYPAPSKHFEDGFSKQEVECCSLRDIFSDYLKADLTDIARDKGMTGYSACKKDKLIDRIIEHMLRPEVMESYFLCLRDDEIEAFERVMSSPGSYAIDNFEKLYCGCYIGVREDDYATVPLEVAAQYKKMNTKDFHRRRIIRSYLLSCFDVVRAFYGIVPVDIMVKLYATNGDVILTEEELCEEAELIPFELSDFVYSQGKFYYGALFLDDRGLPKVQGEKSFYIPTREEVISMATVGYLPENVELKKFIDFLTGPMKIDKRRAEHVGETTQCLIRNDGTMQEVIDNLEAHDILVSGESQMHKLILCINDLWNHTRMLTNRGHMPSETSNNPLGQNSDNKIIGINRAARRKVYPNEPCPCGSGKKYKNCCGKDR